jgi:hypothetical protein
MRGHFCAALVVYLLAAAGFAGAATLQVPQQYPTIQQALDAAQEGDTVLVSAGSYPEKLSIATRGITLEGDGSYPVINPAVSGYYDAAIYYRADDITIRGFEITNSLGATGLSGEQCGIWDGAWVLGPSGLTVDDCVFHDIQHGVRSYGPDLTVTDCEFYNLRRSGVHASGPDSSSGGSNQPLPMTVRGNWFHDWIEYYKEGAAVHVKYRNRVGEVSHNYISGMRMGIAYYYGGPLPGYDEILFTHNTIDMDYDPVVGPVLMTMGFSLWGTDLNADAVIIRDNIFANARWYAIYQEGGTIDTSILVDNNLFHENYWFYWPNYQYPHQWFGDDWRAQAGWYSGDGDEFTFTNNLSATDPKFELSGSGCEEQWALQSDSPACNAASDGTNIGAWQGACAVGVVLDLRPNNTDNQVNTQARMLVPIAILGSDGFDPVQEVELFSIVIHGASPSLAKFDTDDVNGDGYPDLTMYFRARDFRKPDPETECGNPDATVELEPESSMQSGQPLIGSDFVSWIGPDCR